MKKVKTLTLTSLLSLGLIAGSLQTASAADANAYAQVSTTANQAAKYALSQKWKGAQATCYIAQKARETAIKAGVKENTPEFQTIIAKTTYKSAVDANIQELLKNKVTLTCKSAAIAGLPRNAALIGGSVLAVGAIAALSNSNDDSDTTSGSRAPVSAE